MRVKGFIHPALSDFFDEQNVKGTRIYIEEIPPDAIRAEADVYDGKFYSEDESIGFISVNTPAHLIGKRVRVIIFEEDI